MAKIAQRAHPASPNVNILCSSRTILKLKKLTLVQCYEQNYGLHLDFTSFSTYVLSLSQDSIHIAFNCCSLVSSYLWQFLSSSLSFMTLNFSKGTGQVPCRRSLNLNFWGFLMIKLSVCIFWQVHRRSDVVSCSVHSIMGYMMSVCPITCDVDPGFLVSVVSVSLLLYKVTFSLGWYPVSP